MADDKNHKKSNKSKVFTLESANNTTREMPSITSLLNRKKFALKGNQPEQPTKPEPIRPGRSEKKEAHTLLTQINEDRAEKTELTLNNLPQQNEVSLKLDIQSQDPIVLVPGIGQQLPVVPPPTIKPSTEVKTLIAVPEKEISFSPALVLEKPELTLPTQVPKAPSLPQSPPPKKSPTAPVPPRASGLNFWDTTKLSQSSDPIGRAMSQLLENGAISVLFMGIQPPPPGSMLPVFEALSFSGSNSRAVLWKGMIWDPAASSKLWKALLKKGIIEIDVNSPFGVLRQAFGVKNSEWLSFVRAGPSQQCRGIIAVVSKESVKAEMTHIKKLIVTEIKRIDSKSAA